MKKEYNKYEEIWELKVEESLNFEKVEKEKLLLRNEISQVKNFKKIKKKSIFIKKFRLRSVLLFAMANATELTVT